MPGNRTIINSEVFAYSNKPKGFFVSGELKFTSGTNSNVSRTILVHGDGFAVVRIAYPTDILEGDIFNVWAGCDKNGNTCATRFVKSVSNSDFIIDGGFDDISKWTIPIDWEVSGSKASHINFDATNALTPSPQLLTIKANTFYEVSLISDFTLMDLLNLHENQNMIYVSIGGVSFYIMNQEEGALAKQIVTKTSAGIMIFPVQFWAGYETDSPQYTNFSIDNLSVKLGGESPGNYANFFGFENVPKPEIML